MATNPLVQCRLPQDDVDRIDLAAARRRLTRSEWLREWLRAGVAHDLAQPTGRVTAATDPYAALRDGR